MFPQVSPSGVGPDCEDRAKRLGGGTAGATHCKLGPGPRAPSGTSGLAEVATLRAEGQPASPLSLQRPHVCFRPKASSSLRLAVSVLDKNGGILAFFFFLQKSLWKCHAPWPFTALGHGPLVLPSLSQSSAPRVATGAGVRSWGLFCAVG